MFNWKVIWRRRTKEVNHRTEDLHPLRREHGARTPLLHPDDGLTRSTTEMGPRPATMAALERYACCTRPREWPERPERTGVAAHDRRDEPNDVDTRDARTGGNQK
jgi:hypothetical protein